MKIQTYAKVIGQNLYHLLKIYIQMLIKFNKFFK
jgi:hypothetical protein